MQHAMHDAYNMSTIYPHPLLADDVRAAEQSGESRNCAQAHVMTICSYAAHQNVLHVLQIGCRMVAEWGVSRKATL